MFRILLSIGLGLALLSGCATTPPPRPAVSSFVTANRILVDSIPYLPSSLVVQAIRGSVTWDPESQVWILRSGSHEVRLASHFPVALIDGVPQRLSSVPILKEGELLLPESLFHRWIAPWAVSPPTALGVPRAFRTIVLDPGHGGGDPGAIGRSGLREKSVTLDIVRRLRDLLLGDGFRVVMTRSDDRFVPLTRRTEIAHREGGDLFVSIHANASRKRSISGFEVYTLSEATDDHARALEAAENASLPEELGETVSEETEAIVWDLLYTEHRAESAELAYAISRSLKAELPSQNRGVKSARFVVLQGSRMPAVLVEVGFLTHRAEEERLRNPAYRGRLAEGIRNGILRFQQAHGKRI